MTIIIYRYLVYDPVPDAARNRHLSRPDKDERDTAHRSTTKERDEEGDPDLQRVTPGKRQRKRRRLR